MKVTSMRGDLCAVETLLLEQLLVSTDSLVYDYR